MRPSYSNSFWYQNEAGDAKLTALWAEGHSATEIGRQLGTNKNVIIGRARRLGLPPRPSPIKRDGEPRVRPPKRMPEKAVTLPALPSVAALPKQVPVPKAAPKPVVRKPVPVPRNPCAWPIGSPKRPGFRFCDAPSVAGKPYCEAHCGVAYKKIERFLHE